MIAGDFSDPTNERIIYLSALGLAIVGLALLVGTIIWWRRGRQENPVLAPLEVMGGRAWAKAPEGDRRRRLDQVRLRGVAADGDEPVRSDPVDLQALVRSVPRAFDDLREPGVVAESAEEPVAQESVSEDQPAAEEVVAADEPVLEEEPVAAEEPVAEEELVADEPAAQDEPDEAEEAAESADEVVDAEPSPDPDPDATSISTVRPPEVVEALASSPNEPSA